MTKPKTLSPGSGLQHGDNLKSNFGSAPSPITISSELLATLLINASKEFLMVFVMDPNLSLPPLITISFIFLDLISLLLSDNTSQYAQKYYIA